MSPVDTVRVYGMSQVVVQLQTYDVQIDMPGLSGTCRFAMNPVLPQNTVLLGSDLGREKLLELLNGLKRQPKPVLAVTRARAAENALASKLAEVKHVSEGACPLALEDIPELNLESATVPEQLVVQADTSSSSIALECSQLSVSFPSLSFDGLSREQFIALQHEDQSLAQLWEFASKDQKSFFVVNGILMCLTSTLNHFSHALVVPTSLRKSVLLAAHDGLGHGGVNAHQQAFYLAKFNG